MSKNEMVSREIIETVIYKSVEMVKCKVNRIGSNTLNNKVKSSLNKFRDKFKNADHEFLQLIASDGSVLGEIEGEENSVTTKLIDYQNAFETQMGDLIEDHNHPTPYQGADGIQNELCTILSEADVENLWHVDVLGFDDNGEAIIGTYTKSITAECPNGSRMTLTRLEGESTNNFVIKDFIDRDYGGHSDTEYWNKLDHDYGDGGAMIDSRYDAFMNVYHEMHESWRDYVHNYESDIKSHMTDWVNTQRDNPNYTPVMYDKERVRYAKEYARNDDYWNDEVKLYASYFNDLGFELSIEWV